MKKLTIYRETWMRGLGPTSLLRVPETGKMCCLGFLGLACGYTKEYLDGVSTPEALLKDIPDLENMWPDGTLSPVGNNTHVIGEMIMTNDSVAITDFLREQRLVGHFRRLGYEVEFVDGEMP